MEHLAQVREAQRVWIALPREVDSWWRQRSQMRVVCGESGWHIEGKGKERARLASATLADDELVFRIEKQK